MISLRHCASALALAIALSATPLTASAKGSDAVQLEILPANAEPVSYDIEITPNIEERNFMGEATLAFDVKSRTKTITVNAIDLEVASALLDGETEATVATDADGQTMTFSFDKALKKGRHEIRLAYSGKIYEQAFGLFASTYPTEGGEKTAIVTQFEPGDARRIAPMWDEPAKKAVFNIAMIVDDELDAVSNMPAEGVEELEGGKMRVDFAPSPKMSSYLLFLSAGDFDRIESEAEGVDLAIISRAGVAERGRYALDATKDILKFYNEYFDTAYPLPKLDQLGVPGAGGFSAMENWGAILYFEPVLLLDPRTATPENKQRIFGVVAHEVAHQWFGDLVTMQWWDDLWLNEGFASWMASKTSAELHPEWDAWQVAGLIRDYAMNADARSTTHPIVQPIRNIEEATLAFDGITYAKGQSVIRMIESYIGEDAFRDGVRDYIKSRAYQNAVTADLWRALEKASDAPVVDIAKTFTLQPGVPLIAVDDVACADGVSTLTMRQLRYGSDAQSKAQALTWKVPVTFGLVGEDANNTIVSGQEPQTASLEGCGPVKLNYGEAGYYRTLYSNDAFDALAGEYGDMAVADRIGLMSDAYALASAGDAPFSRFMALIETTEPASASPLLLSTAASKLGSLRYYYEGEPGEDLFNAFARDWLATAFATIGWDGKPGDSDNVVNLRNSLIGELARFGDDDVIAEARRRYAAFEKDPAGLDPSQVRMVLRVVAATADQATFDKLVAKATGSADAVEQRQIFSALAGVQDPALAEQALALFLSDKTPPQLRSRLFSSLTGDHPRLVWDYYRQNFEAIDALNDPLTRLSYGAGLASSGDDASYAEELQAFADAHLPEEADAPVARAISSIMFRAGVKSDRLPELTEWLEARE